jgi:hypothetical protein
LYNYQRINQVKEKDVLADKEKESKEWMDKLLNNEIEIPTI